MRRDNKYSTLRAFAIIAAIVGALIAIGLYLRAKAKDISEKLDFDADLYDDEEDEMGACVDPLAPEAEAEIVTLDAEDCCEDIEEGQ